MRLVIFFFFALNCFLVKSQSVVLREYYSNVPGQIVSGDTIQLFPVNSNVNIPILVEIDSDTAVEVEYNLIKIEDNTCVYGILNVVFEPDYEFQSSCFSTNTQNPNSFTFSVEQPNTTVLTLRTNLNFNCLGCFHYRYTVSINGVLKDSVDLKSCNTLSISSEEQQELAVFPNPFSDHVFIHLDENNAQLVIYDPHGKQIQSQIKYNGDQILLKDLETGVYFFEVITENGSVVKRVVKQ